MLVSRSTIGFGSGEPRPKTRQSYANWRRPPSIRTAPGSGSLVTAIRFVWCIIASASSLRRNSRPFILSLLLHNEGKPKFLRKYGDVLGESQNAAPPRMPELAVVEGAVFCGVNVTNRRAGRSSGTIAKRETGIVLTVTVVPFESDSISQSRKIERSNTR